jgi:hypothetical protein
MSPLFRKSDSGSKKPFGCLKFLFFLLIILLVVLHFITPPIIQQIVNSKLPEALNTEASLGTVKLNLLTGTAGIKNLSIAQPEGFEGDALLNIKKFEVSVPVGAAIGRDPLIVKNLHLDGLDFRMITDTNQVANVTRLGPPPSNEPEVIEESETPPPPPVWIQKLLLENITVAIEDLSKEWNLDIRDLRLEVTDLRIEHASDTGPGLISGTVSIVSPKSIAKLRLLAKVDSIYPSNPEQAPALQLAMGLIGFDLDSISPFLAPSPTAAKTAIQGSGFDFILYAQVTPGATLLDQSIFGRYALTTDSGNTLKGKLGGTLQDPDLPFLNIAAQIFGNQVFGRVSSLGVNVAQGGLEAGKTVLKTGGEAAKGIGNTALKFGGGILKTGKGIVTLDGKEAMGGLKDATVGTVGEAANTVSKTAGTAAEGIGKTAGTVTGRDDKDAWWKNVPERQAAFEVDAKAWFEVNSFPPSKPGEPTATPEPTPAAPKDEKEDSPAPVPTVTESKPAEDDNAITPEEPVKEGSSESEEDESVNETPAESEVEEPVAETPSTPAVEATEVGADN